MTMPPTSPNLDALLAHSRWVRALAHHLVDDPASADDVEQDAWVTALERPPSHGGNLRSWWSSVVRSSAGKGWREQKRRREVEESLANRGFDPAISSPEPFTQRMETFRRLAFAVSQLPDPYGAAVYLRYFEEKSVREVAKHQGVPLATAQSHITRGLERLRGNLQESLGSDWRQCCLIFTLPLKATSWLTLGTTAILAMNLKTLSAALAALILLTSLAVWATTDSAPTNPNNDALASATLDAHAVSATASADALEPATALIPPPQLERENQTAALAYQGPFFEVIVRDAHTLKALPFATVYLTDRSTLTSEQTRYLREHRPDPVRTAELFSVEFQADASGKVQIPILPGQLILDAVSGDRFAHHWQADTPRENDVVELLALPEIYFDVKVQNEAGVPVAGVAIGFESVPLAYAGHPSRQVKTDEHGIAHFSHLEGDVEPENQSGCSIAMLLPSQALQSLEVSSDSLHGSTVTFIYPETGSVLLKVEKTNGEPVRNGVPITLQLHQETPGLLQPPSKFTANRQVSLQRNPMVRYVVDGMVKFENVGVGTKLTASTFDRKMMTYFVQDLEGPSQAGEVVDAVLWFVGPSASIPLQLMQENETPHPPGWVKATISWVDVDGEAMGKGMDFEVGEGGLSALELAPGMEKMERFLLSVGQRTQMGTPPSSLHLGIEFVEGFPARTAEETLKVEVGAQTLLAGRVVDQNGNPYASCLLRLYVQENAQDGKLALSDYWDLQTDDQGEFAIHAPMAIEGMQYKLYPQVRGEHFNRQLEPISFSPGNAKAELMVPRSSRFEGRVLVSDASFYASMQLQLVTGVPGQPGSSYQYIDIDPRNGRFHSNSLQDDSYSLVLRSKGSFERLASLESLHQMATIMNGNLQLPDWDLRDQVFAHHLKVSLVDGHQPERITLRFPYNDEFSSIESGPELSMLSRTQFLAMQIQVPGYKMEEVMSEGEVDIVLGIGIPLRVHLSTEVPQQDGVIWRIGILQLNPNGKIELQSFGLPTVTTVTSKVVDLRASAPGAWGLVLQATTPGREGDAGFEGVYLFADGMVFPISVTDSESTQEFEVVLDATQLADLVDQVLAN